MGALTSAPSRGANNSRTCRSAVSWLPAEWMELKVLHSSALETARAVTDPVRRPADGPSGWILAPLSNSCVMFIIWIYKALNSNSSPIIDCCCMGAVPK